VFQKARTMTMEARGVLCGLFREMHRAPTRALYVTTRDRLLRHIQTSPDIKEKYRNALNDYVVTQVDGSPFHHCLCWYTRMYYRHGTNTNNQVGLALRLQILRVSDVIESMRLPLCVGSTLCRSSHSLDGSSTIHSEE